MILCDWAALFLESEFTSAEEEDFFKSWEATRLQFQGRNSYLQKSARYHLESWDYLQKKNGADYITEFSLQ